MKSSDSWSSERIAGKPCELFEPAVPNEHGYALVFLHDEPSAASHSLGDLANQFARHGLRVVSPFLGRTWWTDRKLAAFDPNLSAEEFVVRRLVADIGQRWQAMPTRIALLGVGSGGQGALRMAFKHPNAFPIVAAISPQIDYHQVFDEDPLLQQLYSDREQARQDTALLHVHPLNWPRNMWFGCHPQDPWFDSADRLHMKLASMGIPHDWDLESTVAAKDYIDSIAPTVGNFLVDRLNRERLRV